jgi:hypothetical protein
METPSSKDLVPWVGISVDVLSLVRNSLAPTCLAAGRYDHPMARRDDYCATLRSLQHTNWPTYLRAQSGLPGPRANLELVQAVADVGDDRDFDELITTDDEYLVLCGTVGLGRVLLEKPSLTRSWALDPQVLVQRAAVAGICEPRLLRTPVTARAAIDVCETVTESFAASPRGERARADVRALRQALGYCWSVAVAAHPVAGLPQFNALRSSADGDVRWIVKENEKKARLAKLL